MPLLQCCAGSGAVMRRGVLVDEVFWGGELPGYPLTKFGEQKESTQTYGFGGFMVFFGWRRWSTGRFDLAFPKERTKLFMGSARGPPVQLVMLGTSHGGRQSLWFQSIAFVETRGTLFWKHGKLGKPKAQLKFPFFKQRFGKGREWCPSEFLGLFMMVYIDGL